LYFQAIQAIFSRYYDAVVGCDVHAVFDFNTFGGNTGADDFAQAIDVDGAACSLASIFWRMASVHGSAPRM